MRLQLVGRRIAAAMWTTALALFLTSGSAFAGGLPLGTTLEDFFQRGTQPDPGMGALDVLQPSTACTFCHSDYDPQVEPYTPWAASMMGQSARDPMFWACLTIANQDAANSGDFCIRCHIPMGFLAGRSVPTDGSALLPEDFDSINCNFCHRLVDPEYPPPVGGPPQDPPILDDLAAQDLVPPQGSNARYIVDPVDSRRGPFDDVPTNPHFPAEIIPSDFHTRAEFCWNCHDVSNPVFTKQEDGTYEVNPIGFPHQTGEQDDMFPLHRTYSEWKNSYYFTAGGVQHKGRFGGNHPTGVMRDCQDCHMPDQDGFGCALPAFPQRPDVPQHSFIGSNTWALRAVRAVDFDGDMLPDFPDSVTGLSDESVDAMIARNTNMLQSASDLELSQIGEQLQVRIINQAGHKLPTGFPDGRRMWINVKFFDIQDAIAFEAGEFDFSTGSLLNPEDTKVYEVRLGLSAEQAFETGLPEGETFHFVLADMILKDNRIPPTGFSNTIADLTGHAAVGATYDDGQHWDDTLFDIPACATRAIVTVYYQIVSDEYATFLRDANTTDNRGQILFDLWDDPAVGNRSAPVEMDMMEIVFPGNPADINGDGFVDTIDMLALLADWGVCPAKGECLSDLDCDGMIGAADFLTLLTHWSIP